jgi:hypothetical protein
MIIGDNDEHGAGERGAARCAKHAANRLNAPVRWALPPKEHKDLRAWFQAQNIPPTDREACLAFGREVLAYPYPECQVREARHRWI